MGIPRKRISGRRKGKDPEVEMWLSVQGTAEDQCGWAE